MKVKLLEDASETLRIVRIGDYDDCACIGAHVGNTSEIGEFRVISHDFNDGAWRVRWKVGAKQQRIALIDQKLNARPTPLLVAPSDRLGALLFLSGFTYVLL